MRGKNGLIRYNSGMAVETFQGTQKDSLGKRLRTKAKIAFSGKYDAINPIDYESTVRGEYQRAERAQALAAFMTHYVDVPPQGEPPSILDIAAGTGIISRSLKEKGYHVTATDLSQRALEFLHTKDPSIQTQQADMNKRLPFADNAFEGATTFWGNRYIKDSEAFLREVYRVLKPGGVFVWPIFPLEGPIWKTRSGIMNPTTSRRLKKTALEAGFTDAEIVRKPLGELRNGPSDRERGLRIIVLKK